MRARLEAEGAAARPVAALSRRAALPGRWQLPAWTWAVAAALLLAVVTPLTLRRAPLLQPSRSPAAREPAASPARPAPPTQAAEGLPKPRAVPSTTAGRTVSPDVEGPLRSARAEAEAVRRDAPAPAEKRGKTPAAAAAANQAVVADSVAPGELAAPERELGVQPEAAFAPAPPAAPAVASAESGTSRSGDTFAATPRAGSAAGALTAARRAAPEATLAEAKNADAGSSADRAFARLATDTPRDASGWRARREAWRAFVAAYPESPLVDEARVRVIEASVSAWRAGADPTDLARAREDAQAYLARKDAVQAARVRALLDGLGH